MKRDQNASLPYFQGVMNQRMSKMKVSNISNYLKLTRLNS